MEKTKYLLLVGEMKELDLFDDVPYKYIKDIIDDDDEQFVVEVEYLPCDIVAYNTVKFTFELDKIFFEFENTYSTSSPYALLLLEYCADDEEEEEEYDGSVYIKKDGNTCFGCRTGGNPKCICDEEEEEEETEEEEDEEWHESLMAKKHSSEEEEEEGEEEDYN